MKSRNKVELIGCVGKDPEIKQFENGKVANLSLATTEKYKDKETTQWHRLKAFGALADVIEKWVKKGDTLCIDGKIQYGSYEKDGQKFQTTDIVVFEINMLKSSKMNEQAPAVKPDAIKADPLADDLPY
jgi:single-strand DNA-binding protein